MTMETKESVQIYRRLPNLIFLHGNAKSDIQASDKGHLNDLVEMLSPQVHILVWF